MKPSPEIEKAIAKFPFVACPYARALAARSEAFRRQMEPDARELEDDEAFGPDPLGLLQHAEVARSDEELSACVNYVQERPDVRDVLLSGGDPLVLPDDEVMRFVRAFADLGQVDVVRLCTRAPCVNPARVTRDLAARLGHVGKVWVNTQFNHADEMTPEAVEACVNLVNAGIPVSCQTVLLAGVNDSVEALLDLFRALQRARVRPYYVFQCDPVEGVAHFRVPLEKAKRLARKCAERIGGLGLPRFVADIPGSARKMPIALL